MTFVLPQFLPSDSVHPTRRLYIQTWGCQMNVYDSDRMADLLTPLGYVLSDSPEDADLIILNTCHIREKATEKLFSELGRLNVHKKAAAAQGKQILITVAGCVAQAEGDEIRARAPYVDLVVGSQAWHHLPKMIAHATRAADVPLQVSFDPVAKFDALKIPITESPVSAFISIQEGCDKFCTFCVVPYTRGAEYSRPVKDILDEVRARVDAGAREITLLGQNVNAYHGEAPAWHSHQSKIWGLGKLLDALVEAVPDLYRVRYTTSHPRDVDDALLAAHRDLPAVMPFLHLPVQSGSDRVLKDMNRHHTADDYRRIIARFRDAQPAIAFSSDFIVGFPSETESDFEATCALVREVEFAQAFSFAYSRRPGTPASALSDQVPEVVKRERLQHLQALLKKQQTTFNKTFQGRPVEVLIENAGREMGTFFGRTPWMQAVRVRDPEPDGRDHSGLGHSGMCATVMVTEAHEQGLSGTLAIA